MAIVSQLCISFPYVLHGLCEDYLTCEIAFNAVMPLSHASTRGRYSRIEGVTLGLLLRRVMALRLLLRLRHRARAASTFLLLRLASKGGRDQPPLRLIRRVVVLLRLVSKERRQPQPLRLLCRRLAVQLPEAGGNTDSVLL